MKYQYLITGLLAAFFCISGHFFIAAYTDYSISQSRLELLRNQERAAKQQIRTYEEQVKQLRQIQAFMDQVKSSGLEKKQWDQFFVDLKEYPVSFQKLQTILAQTHNSGQYYFKPGKLSIKIGAPEINAVPNESPESGSSNTKSAQPDNATPTLHSNKGIPEASDLTINIDGRFLVKRRGAG